MQPLIVINTVGLTARHLPSAPRLHQLAQEGWHRPLRETLPAVTMTAQATMLTGQSPQTHGIVGNGWFWRDTGEVRFWLQANRLIQAEPLYQTARRRRRAEAQGKSFRCAKLFWWFNQGAAVDVSVTPKPHYGTDGNKLFDIAGTPPDLPEDLQRRLGPFPFANFWGPMAGLPASAWIARCAGLIVEEQRPDLTLVYLPHLDYDTQRLGPDKCDWRKLARELDDACVPILEAAKKIGARVWIVNECTHVPVTRAVHINQSLRRAELLQVRAGPFGEMLDTFGSRAFAVCDHQIAHVYVRDVGDIPRVRDHLQSLDGVARIFTGDERAEVRLDHPRAGDVVAFSTADAWFAYPFWLDDTRAPDYARTVNIHAKPGYDPCELFVDPKLFWPMGRMARRLLQKKLGFRTLFDVVPLETSLVKGSHGLAMDEDQERPVMIGDGAAPTAEVVEMTAVHAMILAAVEC